MIAFGRTDQGLIRSSNQDQYLIAELEGAMLVIVCDGMGGANGGETASLIAVQRIEDYVREGYRPELDAPELSALLLQSMLHANMDIYGTGNHTPELYGMGTTAVVAIAREDYAVIGNIGDSRAYLLEGSTAEQITKDHSMVQEMLDIGNLSKDEAKNHPKKNIITRALGIGPHCEIDLFEVKLNPGQYLVLCTDGLSNLIDEKELALELSSLPFGQERIDQLVEMANERGGTDNITVVAITPATETEVR